MMTEAIQGTRSTLCDGCCHSLVIEIDEFYEPHLTVTARSVEDAPRSSRFSTGSMTRPALLSDIQHRIKGIAADYRFMFSSEIVVARLSAEWARSFRLGDRGI